MILIGMMIWNVGNKMKILSTHFSGNILLENKEYILQKSNYGYRVISWHPHYITSDWVENRNRAIDLGKLKVAEYYNNIIIKGFKNE